MTMQCSETQRFLDAYIDGEFDASDRAEIERHVAGCERCRVEIERQRAWKSALRARLARPVAPYALHRRVREALEDEDVPEPLWRRMVWRFTPAVLVSAALAALILRPEPSSPIVRESVVDHELNLPVEVNGPDPRLVGQWF